MDEVRIGIFHRGTKLYDWPALIVNDDIGRRVELQDLQRRGMVLAGDEVTFTTPAGGFWSYIAEDVTT